MSKAFKSEETPFEAKEVREPPRSEPGEMRYITPEGYLNLQAELHRLRSSERSSSRREAEDRTHRILWLERTLLGLTVLGAEPVPEGEVGFGTWVTVEDEGGSRVTWRLVGPDEADARQGTISALSPVGSALLGRTKGEVVEVQKPGGAREYLICEVERTPPKGDRETDRAAAERDPRS